MEQLESPTEIAAEKSTYTLEYWLKWIRASKDAGKRHYYDSKDSYREYEKDFNEKMAQAYDNRQQVASTYPIFWSSLQTLMPAYYARTPKLNVERAFNITDDVANTAGLIFKRMGDYQVRCGNFDEIMNAEVCEYINAAKATTQLVY